MIFEPLSPNAEQVLKDILAHRYENGNIDSSYWEDRFAGLEYDEDIRLRSLFKELEDEEMIHASWASDTVYMLTVFDKGYSYFENKKIYEKEKKRLSRREWSIAIIAAIIGALIGQIPDIIQWIGEKVG